ncbi:MAG TPA: radical SAM protein [Mycobacteriales bacterium]|nr:radical SAM protein [Mycobacteriales bacterium]
MVILDLIEAVSAVGEGSTVRVRLTDPGDADLARKWCHHSGNTLLELTDQHVVVRRGRVPDALDELPADRRPGARLWLYTNFDCNLACDYCCVRSSPRAPRRELGLDRIRQLCREAPAAGVGEILITGGEPFLLPDIAEIVDACAAAAPTTVLTNGMLLRGRRLELLHRMPRDRVRLQISLDSADPVAHDAHRGAGSWQRAVDGITAARAAGFVVRVAATVGAAETGQAAALAAYLDGIGVARDDQLIRPLARRGLSGDGVTVTVETLVPELTVTADGIYWHPVGADDDDQLVSREQLPLTEAVALVNERFRRHRLAEHGAAERFPCA